MNEVDEIKKENSGEARSKNLAVQSTRKARSAQDDESFSIERAMTVADQLCRVEVFPQHSDRYHIFIDGIRTIVTDSERSRDDYVGMIKRGIQTGIYRYLRGDQEFDDNTQTILNLKAEVERLTNLIDTPHTDDFMTAVPLEAAHQIKRWGVEHDEGKTPFDWFWLVGYLAQKAATAAVKGDVEKAKHHTISTAACMLNWFRRLTGDDKTFQPGIDEPHTCNQKG